MVLVSCIWHIVCFLLFLIFVKYKLTSIRLITECSAFFHNYIEKGLTEPFINIQHVELTHFISLLFHIETSHLICSVNQVTCFNMKCNTWLRWVKIFSWIMFRILYYKSCWNIVKHFEYGKTRLLHAINSQRSVNATCENVVCYRSVYFLNTLSHAAGGCILKLIIFLLGKM